MITDKLEFKHQIHYGEKVVNFCEGITGSKNIIKAQAAKRIPTLISEQ